MSDPTTDNIDAAPQDVVPLTVGDLRRAMEGLPDDAQAFIEGSGLGRDTSSMGDRKVVGAIQSQQIPWSNPDWQKGDAVVVGFELWAEHWDDAAPDSRLAARLTGVVADADQLREVLDQLNDSGIDPTAAGIDGRGAPFLAMMRGPYAEHDVVLFNTPWDSETETSRGYRCDDCAAQEPATFADITFPVTLLLPALTS